MIHSSTYEYFSLVTTTIEYLTVEHHEFQIKMSSINGTNKSDKEPILKEALKLSIRK